jgi:hypothetical protein
VKQNTHLTTDETEVMEDIEDMTVGSVYESIETNMWLAEAYFKKGSEGLGIECLRAAWWEYVRFRDVLHVYSGDELGKRLVETLVDRAGDAALMMAFGEGKESASLRQALASAA